eukprot:6153463-Pyramimonas_sp.AAC.1
MIPCFGVHTEKHDIGLASLPDKSTKAAERGQQAEVLPFVVCCPRGPPLVEVQKQYYLALRFKRQ